MRTDITEICTCSCLILKGKVGKKNKSNKHLFAKYKENIDTGWHHLCKKNTKVSYL